MSFTNVYPNVVTFDTQKALYGTAALDSSVAPYMADQLHPNGTGQAAEAAEDIQVLTSLRSSATFQTAGPVDPNSVNTLVPFSPFLAANARTNSYTQPWVANGGSSGAMYPYACADPNYYTLVATGKAAAGAAGQSYLRFTWNGTVIAPIQPYDVIEQQSAGCWQLNRGTYSTNQSNGIAQINLPSGQTTPYPLVSGEQLNFYRPKIPERPRRGISEKSGGIPICPADLDCWRRKWLF